MFPSGQRHVFGRIHLPLPQPAEQMATQNIQGRNWDAFWAFGHLRNQIKHTLQNVYNNIRISQITKLGNDEWMASYVTDFNGPLGGAMWFYANEQHVDS